MDNDIALDRRQIWARPSMTTTSSQRHCTALHLPSRGLLTIDSTSTITLSHNAVFQPECTAIPSSVSNDSAIVAIGIDLRDPFYASTSPQIYALATATVISYTLFVMLCIAPRTFFFGGPGGGGGFLGPRGIMSGQAPIRIGGRPWLQIVATLLVAISLTIATINTFKIAEEQYNAGQEDAVALTADVAGSLELRVIRVISTTFLWLAQAQTLIRLFPRHREKITIKWTGFALIVLDTIFSILNNFVDNSTKSRPRSFTDAIPALDYLFELALSILYAACVLYYSFQKRLFAFYHPSMRNISMVAILSLVAIMIPVVFFVLDIANSTLAGWGDYFRWVGAAAASVVVWEWVERIEALEREHNKDSILGDRVYDADEMITATSTSIGDWPVSRHSLPHDGRVRSTHTTGSSRGHDFSTGNSRSRFPTTHAGFDRATNTGAVNQSRGTFMSSAMRQSRPGRNNIPAPPLAVASPVSRTDTTSAASTIYAVRYNTIIDSTSPSPQLPLESADPLTQGIADQPVQPTPDRDRHTQNASGQSPEINPTTIANMISQRPTDPVPTLADRLVNAANPFKRRRTHSTSGPTGDMGGSSSVDVQRNSDGRPWIFGKPSRFGFRTNPKSSEAQMGTTIVESSGIRYLPPGVEHDHYPLPNSSSSAEVPGSGYRSRYNNVSAGVSSPSEPRVSRIAWQDFGDPTSPNVVSALHQRGTLWISDPRASLLTQDRSDMNPTLRSSTPLDYQPAPFGTEFEAPPPVLDSSAQDLDPELTETSNGGVSSSERQSRSDTGALRRSG
ncbi:pH-response regulator protein palH/rim21 [Xylographa trunciseda]|nr:pH-response regulator protein palH/rim21 [Xylographa trunciseda]